MLDHEGFDLWADSYDRSTACSDESGSYPFAGYSAVLQDIFGVFRLAVAVRIGRIEVLPDVHRAARLDQEMAGETLKIRGLKIHGALRG